MKALSLDMGGSHIGCALVEDHQILALGSLPVIEAQGIAALLTPLAELLHALLRSVGNAATDCAGMAIGFPGIVEFRTGTIHATLKKYDDARHIDLKEWCRSEFGLPLGMENDARMALLGEVNAGAAMGYDDVTMMTLGTGIGGAALMHGKLVRGRHAQAGCLGGHLPVDFEGRLCACGNIGCAEAEAGGWAVPGIARGWPGFAQSALASHDSFGFREIFNAAAEGDSVATAVRDRCIAVWASNAVANIHAYDPEVVVVGGGVMQSADVIIPRIQEHVNRHAWSGWGKPEVRAAALGNEAGLLGAVPLLREVLHGANS